MPLENRRWKMEKVILILVALMMCGAACNAGMCVEATDVLEVGHE
jgi:hypothetical protein